MIIIKYRKKKRTNAAYVTCSKKILIISYICGIVLTAITIIGCFMGYDMTAVGTITCIAYGEISVSNAFYYNKAKHENAIKIAFNCIQEMPEKINDNTDIASLINAIKS